MAKRLLEGDSVDKDEVNLVSFLRDCVAHYDGNAMVMLAKWCAHGQSIDYNVQRAKALVSEAAEKGNDEARILLQIINECEMEEPMNWACL